MTYNTDKTWADLSRSAGISANTAVTTLVSGQVAYDEWQSFRAGRTNLEIATDLAVTETAVAEMDSCYAALKAIHDYANNQTPVQGDYFYSLRKFS
jgi:hypothetical protein